MHRTVTKLVLLSALLSPLVSLAQDGDSEGRAAIDSDPLGELLISDYVDEPELSYTGPLVDSYPNGQKKFEVNFVKGKPDGVMITWHENGQKETEASFVYGKREGPMTMWHANGKKKARGNWVNDKPDGPWVVWHENGQIAFEGSFRNGKQMQGSQWWDEHGNTIVRPE